MNLTYTAMADCILLVGRAGIEPTVILMFMIYSKVHSARISKLL